MPESHQQACLLCASTVQRENDQYCCTGCEAVHQILSHQKVVQNYQDHPLFKQALQAGLISNPHLIEQLREQQATAEGDIQKIYLEIEEMWCPSCAQVISLILLREKGIKACHVDYSTDLAVIEYAPRYISKEKIFRLIEQLGYRPCRLEDPQYAAISRSLYWRFIVAAFFAGNIMMFSYPIYASYFHAEENTYALLFSWLSLICTIPVLVYSAWPIWRRCYSALKVGIWGMELLVLMGVSAAFGLSVYELWSGSLYVYFDSLTVIVAFVLLGKIIESKAKFSAKDSLAALTRSLPRRGRKRFIDGTAQFVSIKDIVPGDHIVVLAGEKIVVDGTVVEGNGACDESLITGESLPVFKKIGSTVIAGSVLQQGHLCITVTSKVEETALHRIVMLVKEEVAHKTFHHRVIDQIVKGFIPVVIGLAILTAIYCLFYHVTDPGYTPLQTAIIRAISILLISCPCAIGIAAPLAESHVLNALAKRGAIVRHRGCLAFLGKETVIVFDKTGTVTEGKFTVQSGLECISEADRMILKGMVALSNHPIAGAIYHALDITPAKLPHVEEVIGKGIHSGEYVLGSALFLKEMGVIIPPFIPTSQTTVYFAKDSVCIATIVLGDRIRPEAEVTIQKLSTIKKWLVSGDSFSVVAAVASKCGFDAWRAEFTPLMKKELIDQLRYQNEVVLMLGDGINDAPALASANVGIAVMNATDLSAQVSDILLTTHRLAVIPEILQIAQKGHQILKQNLFWAFFYNIVGIGLAMGGLLSPIFAAFAMVTSSIIVLLNAQRIK